MMRVLYIPAVNSSQAEGHFRRISAGLSPALEAYLSEGACRHMVERFPPAFRANSRIWAVTERFGPDGPMVVAQDITERPANVIGLTARARQAWAPLS